MKDSILIYQTQDGNFRTEVTLKNESIWLTQNQLSELFGTQRPAITKHLTQIFKDKELCEDSVCSITERTADDGKQYKTKFYNLDAIIAVGYRVNSKKATEFRIWANHVLKDYLIKGYALDEQRLKHRNSLIVSWKMQAQIRAVPYRTYRKRASGLQSEILFIQKDLLLLV